MPHFLLCGIIYCVNLCILRHIHGNRTKYRVSSSSLMVRAPSVNLGCIAAWWLIVLTLYGILPVTTFAARCLSSSYKTRNLQAAKGGTTFGRENQPIFCLEMPTSTIQSRVLLHAVNLRHATDGLTSPSIEGVLRIFCP